jgi:hypothetical protein
VLLVVVLGQTRWWGAETVTPSRGQVGAKGKTATF